MNMTAIAIVAICAWALVTIVESAKDKSKKKLSSKETDAYKAEIAELKERVSVLEKIVTDERYDLKKAICRLRKRPRSVSLNSRNSTHVPWQAR